MDGRTITLKDDKNKPSNHWMNILKTEGGTRSPKKERESNWQV